MKEELDYEIGSGNVFADLGRPNADELFAKGLILIEIRKAIEESQLSHKKIADKLGVHPSRISEIAHGKFSGYSLERLISLLNGLDRNVEIRVRQKPAKQKEPAFVRVISA